MAGYTDEQQEAKFQEFEERISNIMDGESDGDSIESVKSDIEDAYAMGAISGQYYDELQDMLAELED